MNATARKFVVLGAVLFAIHNIGTGQCPVATTYAGGNAQSGNMFDVVAINAVTLTAIDQNLSAGTHNIAVYTKPGTYVGSQANAAAWTLLGTATGVASLGAGLPTPIPVAINIPLAAGATQGFYVTATTTTVPYTNGTAVGNVAGQDLNIRVLEGIGVAYLFGGNFTPRVWNGTMRYTSGFPDFQDNQPGASLTIDSVQGSVCSKAVVTRKVCSPQSLAVTVNASLASTSNPGGAWDLLFTASPAVPALSGGAVTTGGQRVNLNLLDPTLIALFGLAGGPPFGNGTIPATFGGPFATTIQMVVFDFASPDGFFLSQPCEIHVNDAGSLLAGPNGDDSFTTQTFASLPCGPASFPFYGTAFASFSVTSNGRVMFGTPSTTAAPSVGSAQGQAASINAWADLDPSPATGGGAVSVVVPTPGIIRVQWAGVPYAGNPGTSNTFAIAMDSSTGVITIENLPGFGVHPGGASMFLGLSAGPPVATNPGGVTFTLGGPNPGPAGLGMLYEFGIAGAMAPGVTNLVFTPNGANNYTWTAF